MLACVHVDTGCVGEDSAEQTSKQTLMDLKKDWSGEQRLQQCDLGEAITFGGPRLGVFAGSGRGDTTVHRKVDKAGVPGQIGALGSRRRSQMHGSSPTLAADHPLQPPQVIREG